LERFVTKTAKEEHVEMLERGIGTFIQMS